MSLTACTCDRRQVAPEPEQALRGWKALDFEQAAADHALVATALRSFAEWDATPQGQAVASLPLITITRIADASQARYLARKCLPLYPTQSLDR